MDFTKEKTATILIRYVVPQMIGLVFNSVYFIVDGVFIGRRLGDVALAAAGVAVPLVEFTIALSMLLSVGTGILISACMGRQGSRAESSREALWVFNFSLRVILAVSLALGLLSNLFILPLARFLGAGPAILADTLAYMRPFLLFSPFFILSFALSTLARNDGRPALAMWALTIGSLSNVLLDWVFMYPLNMGLAGAALATGLGPVFSVVILAPHFIRRGGKAKGALYLKRMNSFYAGTGAGAETGGVTPGAAKTLGKILSFGLPAFVSEFSIGLVTLLYNRAILQNGYGEKGVQPVVSFLAKDTTAA